jgi:(p)ppGpp synthase/HD superfamily hydrolase
MTPTLGQTLALVAEMTKNKVDRAGEPYFMHLMRVMLGVKTIKQKICALLHDSVEDGEITLDELREMGYPHDYIRTVDALTHRDGEDYEVYIRRIAMDEDARIIKLEDLKDNSQVTRLKGLRAKDFQRLEKYCKAYVYLSN